MKKKREIWLDVVKAIAIFIVLLNHANIKIPGVNFWGGMFYVPVFFVTAGYTYHMSEKHSSFIKDKAKRLFIPYFAANAFLLCFFAVKEIVLNGELTTVNLNSVVGIFYGRNQLLCKADNTGFLELFTNLNIDNIYFMNILNAPTWFLPALFMSMIIFDGLMRVTRQDQKKIAIIVTMMLLIQVNYHYLVPFLLPFSIDMLPFFVTLIQVGYVVKNNNLFAKIGKKSELRIAFGIGTVLFILLALVNGSVNLSVGEMGDYIMLALYNSVASSLIIMYLCYLWGNYKEGKYMPKWLSKCGRYTLSILCYHLFVFMFIGGAISIVTRILGMDKNAIVMTFLHLGMVIVTMAGFTLGGVKIGKKR